MNVMEEAKNVAQAIKESQEYTDFVRAKENAFEN